MDTEGHHDQRGATMIDHTIVSHEEWIAARQRLLAKEKDFLRLRDQLTQERRELPWERVGKPYAFESINGRQTLADLFDGRSQLIVYHFMFAPEWDTGCPSCSFWADSFNGVSSHLNQRDVSFVAASRAPLRKLQAFAARMNWNFKWVSSADSDFNFDYQVSFRPADLAHGSAVYNYKPHERMTDMPGFSVFFRDGADIYYTYSTFARGLDSMNAAYQLLDLVPKGRDESDLPFPMAWVRLHDQYAQTRQPEYPWRAVGSERPDSLGSSGTAS
jgi:predicted dithiol-disulfide oxidoreductase (DUF899 family)